MEPRSDRTLAGGTDRHVMAAGHVLFAILLMLGTIRASIDAQAPWIPVCAAVVFTAWYAAGAVWVPRHDGALRRTWMGGLITIWLGLLLISGEFVWMAFLLALLVWHLFPMRAAVVLEIGVALASVIGFAAHLGYWASGAVLGPVIGVGCAAGMTEIYQRMRAQSEERRRLLTELTRTQQALADREREAGRMAERERLAREIHDTVGQSLASVIMLLRAALDSQTENARMVHIGTAVDTASAALAETRRVVRGMSSTADDLPVALRTLVDDTTALGMATSFEVHGDRGAVAAPARHALIRATQEALANARRHSGADALAVTLTYQADEVSVDVVDDGHGFDPQTVGVRSDGSGFGLVAMRGRLSEVGGDVIVESDDQVGTAVRVTVPTTAESPDGRAQ